MKVLHLLPLQVPSSGIVAQVLAEHAIAGRLGLPWDVRIFTHAPLPEAAESVRLGERLDGYRGSGSWVSYAAAKMRHRAAMYDWLTSHESEYGAILLRHTYADPVRHRSIARLKTPLFSVHHTLEVPELRLSGGVTGWLRAEGERLWGGRSIRAADGIIGVTPEIVEYERTRSGSVGAAHIFPNGIDLEAAPLYADDRGDLPEILFVASRFEPWHGLDLVIDAAERANQDFVLHLVGEVPRQLAESAERNPRIRMHGVLRHADIRQVAAKAWIGLSSFGLFRQGMQQAATLKVREYLASGLATYAGHRDVFPVDAPYFRSGSVEFDEILAYARSMRKMSRSQVRELSSAHISKELILRRVYEELSS